MSSDLDAALAWVDEMDDLDSEDLANCTEEAETEVRRTRTLAAEVRRLQALEARLTPLGLLAAFRDAAPEEYLYAHDAYVVLDGQWDFARVLALLSTGGSR